MANITDGCKVLCRFNLPVQYPAIYLWPERRGFAQCVVKGDVIVTTQKTIDLVFHTQVFKLQRASWTLSRS